MQLLFEKSQEGILPGFGILKGTVKKFTAVPEGLKVPHMGWNEVIQNRSHALWQDIQNGERFYFVHSYCVEPVDRSNIVGTTDYGLPFTSAVARDNIFALQCHPEKSAQAGLTLLSNFIQWKP